MVSEQTCNHFKVLVRFHFRSLKTALPLHYVNSPRKSSKTSFFHKYNQSQRRNRVMDMRGQIRIVLYFLFSPFYFYFFYKYCYFAQHVNASTSNPSLTQSHFKYTYQEFHLKRQKKKRTSPARA